MRRFLTTLMMQTVVLVAGLSALVLLVNPNDFRDYMVKQVAARSGYQLQLDGPLRWHVWPQQVSPGECLSPPRAQASHWFAPSKRPASGRGAFTTTESSTER